MYSDTEFNDTNYVYKEKQLANVLKCNESRSLTISDDSTVVKILKRERDSNIFRIGCSILTSFKSGSKFCKSKIVCIGLSDIMYYEHKYYNIVSKFKSIYVNNSFEDYNKENNFVGMLLSSIRNNFDNFASIKFLSYSYKDCLDFY